MTYNPYDLLRVIIDGQETTGRPFEFDSEIVDTETLVNGFGNVVKPSKVSTACPNCGQGLFLDVTLGDPPFEPIYADCGTCRPKPTPMADPFVDPLSRLPSNFLEPTIIALNPITTTVEESITPNPELVALLNNVSVTPKKTQPKKVKSKKSKSKVKPKQTKPKSATTLDAESDLEFFKKQLTTPLQLPKEFVKETMPATKFDDSELLG